MTTHDLTRDDLVKRLDVFSGAASLLPELRECLGKAARRIEALQAALEKWKHIAKHGLAKCTPEHTWAEWLAEVKADADRRVEEERELLLGVVEALPVVEGEPSDELIAEMVMHPEEAAEAAGNITKRRILTAMRSAIRARSNDAKPDDGPSAFEKIAAGLKDAVRARISKITVEGVTWVRQEERQEVGGEDVLAGDIIAACDEYGLAPDGTSIEAEAMFGLIRAISHARDRMAELHREHQPVGGGWQDISTAPKTRPIVVETEAGRIFKAKWVVVGDDAVGWGTVNEDDPCPTCWTDGFCWESNADEEPSDKPVRWCELHKHSPLPSPPELQSEPVGGEKLQHSFDCDALHHTGPCDCSAERGAVSGQDGDPANFALKPTGAAANSMDGSNE